jgi:hypothetical protein
MAAYERLMNISKCTYIRKALIRRQERNTPTLLSSDSLYNAQWELPTRLRTEVKTVRSYIWFKILGFALPSRESKCGIWRNSTLVPYKYSFAKRKISGTLNLWVYPFIFRIWACRVLFTIDYLVFRLGTSNFQPTTFYSTNMWEK